MNAALADRTRQAFMRHFSAEPEGFAFAPGRVNLIGEHVDYNDGLVLPLPLPLGTLVAWRRNDRGVMRAVATDFEDETDSFHLGETAETVSGWRTYLRGMTAVLQGAGTNGQTLDLAIAGDLPRGAGLSSSASLCVALGRALQDGGMVEPATPQQLAKAAQRTEHEFAAVACGIMDQMASACGHAGQAMLLDCRSLEMQHLPLPPEWAVMVVQSGVTRGLVDGAYNLRRKQCEGAARALGMASLREAKPNDLDSAKLPEIEATRARHVVDEIARVRAAVDCLANGDLQGFGQLLNASHASLRDLFEVSHPSVDRLVAILQDAIGDDGGARLTGGGFGGAVVAIVASDKVDQLRELVASEYSSTAAAGMLIVGTGGALTSKEVQSMKQDEY